MEISEQETQMNPKTTLSEVNNAHGRLIGEIERANHLDMSATERVEHANKIASLANHFVSLSRRLEEGI